MDYLLLIVIILQSAYIFYQHKSSQDEREKLQLKLMSKDTYEYKEAVEKEPQKAPEPEKDPYIALDEVDVEELIKAKDKI